MVGAVVAVLLAVVAFICQEVVVELVDAVQEQPPPPQVKPGQ